MSNPILTTLERRGLKIGLWDACRVANAIRWDELRLEDFHLSREARVHLIKLLRRMDYLELKFEGSAGAYSHCEEELKALKWAIAAILYVAGEKSDEEKAAQQSAASAVSMRLREEAAREDDGAVRQPGDVPVLALCDGTASEAAGDGKQNTSY